MTTYKISPSIRTEIAKCIVKQSEPDYHGMGEYYAVDTDADAVLDTVAYKGNTAPWNPWHDNAVAVPVAMLYEDSVASFDPTPDYDLMEEDDNRNDDEFAQDAFDNAVLLAENELPETVEVE
jgi:hypothetical protein